MKEEYHKHAGIVKPHPVSRLHNTKEAINAHNKAVAPKTMKKFENLDQGSKNYKSMELEFSIDDDNYIMIDLTKNINVEGVRIKFVRRRQTIGLQIEK